MDVEKAIRTRCGRMARSALHAPLTGAIVVVVALAVHVLSRAPTAWSGS